jgi:hypothetical protein
MIKNKTEKSQMNLTLKTDNQELAVEKKCAKVVKDNQTGEHTKMTSKKNLKLKTKKNRNQKQ